MRRVLASSLVVLLASGNFAFGQQAVTTPSAVGTAGKVEAAAPDATVATSRSEEVPEEFNVIGNTAEEARERVDKYLDQAFLGGRSRVRIIHGHGKGILRRTLHEMFSQHPHVEKFYLAPPQEGGGGATIVELRT